MTCHPISDVGRRQKLTSCHLLPLTLTHSRLTLLGHSSDAQTRRLKTASSPATHSPRACASNRTVFGFMTRAGLQRLCNVLLLPRGVVVTPRSAVARQRATVFTTAVSTRRGAGGVQPFSCQSAAAGMALYQQPAEAKQSGGAAAAEDETTSSSSAPEKLICMFYVSVFLTLASHEAPPPSFAWPTASSRGC